MLRRSGCTSKTLAACTQLLWGAVSTRTVFLPRENDNRIETAGSVRGCEVHDFKSESNRRQLPYLQQRDSTGHKVRVARRDAAAMAWPVQRGSRGERPELREMRTKEEQIRETLRTKGMFACVAGTLVDGWGGIHDLFPAATAEAKYAGVAVWDQSE